MHLNINIQEYRNWELELRKKEIIRSSEGNKELRETHSKRETATRNTGT